MTAPRNEEETVMFLSRVYSDLSVADGFVGTTGEKIMQAKAREALASFTAFLREGIDHTENMDEHDFGYNTAVDDVHALLDEKIRKLES